MVYQYALNPLPGVLQHIPVTLILVTMSVTTYCFDIVSSLGKIYLIAAYVPQSISSVIKFE